MPTSTFFNLSEDKRDKILKAAKEEFLKYSFYDASINRIIKEAGISRGAFYMYFENKEDIFSYLIEGYRDNILDNVMKSVNKDECDIFHIAMMAFDYVTSIEMNTQCKELFGMLITKIDLNLINHLVDLQDDNMKISIMKRYSNTDKLRYKEERELIFIGEFVFTAIMSEIVLLFLGKNSVEEARKNLECKFNLIKYGILK